MRGAGGVRNYLGGKQVIVYEVAIRQPAPHEMY